MVEIWKQHFRLILGDKVLHRSNVIHVAMCCIGYKTTAEGALSFVSGGVKGRCAECGFVARLRFFKFQEKRFLRGIEEATDLQMNDCKIANRAQIMVNCKSYRLHYKSICWLFPI